MKKEKEENTIERSNGPDICSWSPMHPDPTPSVRAYLEWHTVSRLTLQKSLLHNLSATPFSRVFARYAFLD